MRFQCTEIIEIFMQHSVRNNSESLKRYKIISRLIKKSSKHLTDETKLALASSAFNAQVWGESQSYLDSIEIEKWDERVVKLYKKIKEKVQKLIYQSITIKFLSEPKWFVQTVIINMNIGNLSALNAVQLIKLIGQKKK